ncbi:MAG: response regulator transcription factor [Actinobacteria bacterium]|nr:MAG: response regulator transcription factor [Actinomycetota bacterium]
MRHVPPAAADEARAGARRSKLRLLLARGIGRGRERRRGSGGSHLPPVGRFDLRPRPFVLQISRLSYSQDVERLPRSFVGRRGRLRQVAIKVLLADDHPLTLQGIRSALEDAGDIEIVGEAQSGSQVLPLIGQTDPDLVVLDIRMPQLDGLACLVRIRARYPKVKVVMLSAYTDRQHIEVALKRGASAYIAKGVNPLDLASALRQAVEGTVFTTFIPAGGEEESPGGLTERELAMLNALTRGLSNQAIGKEYWVTEQTVKFHLSNIYRKLGVANRTEAARFAYEHGLVEPSAANLG